MSDSKPAPPNGLTLTTSQQIAAAIAVIALVLLGFRAGVIQTRRAMRSTELTTMSRARHAESSARRREAELRALRQTLRTTSTELARVRAALSALERATRPADVAAAGGSPNTTAGDPVRTFPGTSMRTTPPPECVDASCPRIANPPPIPSHPDSVMLGDDIF